MPTAKGSEGFRDVIQAPSISNDEEQDPHSSAYANEHVVHTTTRHEEKKFSGTNRSGII